MKSSFANLRSPMSGASRRARPSPPPISIPSFLRERGWSGDAAPDPEGIAESFAVQGYVDDSAYALMKSRALSGRGYGKRRVAQALRAAGIGGDDSGAAHELADQEAV